MINAGDIGGTKTVIGPFEEAGQDLQAIRERWCPAKARRQPCDHVKAESCLLRHHASTMLIKDPVAQPVFCLPANAGVLEQQIKQMRKQ